MKVRLFNKEKDYKTLCKWWDDWGSVKRGLEELPNTGIIISKNNIDMCIGFIYSTDSCITWFEHVIMNKKITKEQRNGVLEKLLDSMVEKAKSMGFKLIMCFGTEKQDNINPTLVKWRNKNIRDVVFNNISHYYKIINK